MSDTKTRVIKRGSSSARSGFLKRFRASVVVVTGKAAGTEYGLESERVTLGRGPGTDLVFDDNSMSRQHAALEVSSRGFRLRDLGSTNGVLLNGSPVEVGDLKHRDRFELGEHEFQYVVEERAEEPGVYALPEEE